MTSARASCRQTEYSFLYHKMRYITREWNFWWILFVQNRFRLREALYSEDYFLVKKYVRIEIGLNNSHLSFPSLEALRYGCFFAQCLQATPIYSKNNLYLSLQVPCLSIKSKQHKKYLKHTKCYSSHYSHSCYLRLSACRPNSNR